ncbi:MAG TPA: retropepsin-like aspartic protease [Bacteroidia bacterium]|nr:retropepsin-like aspartic protease [Bacteroidia bacterium]
MKVCVPVRLLSIEGDGYHLLVRIRINGKNANVILDTGASKTVFDLKRIAGFLKAEKMTENDRLSTGLGTASMESQLVFLQKISIGTFVLENFPAVVLDLSHVNTAYHTLGLSLVDGVIGSDILEACNAVIDYGKKTLTLNPGVKKKKAGRKRMLVRKRD